MFWMVLTILKCFQIGSNENQTMNISIGSMHSSVLGVATSNSAAASMAQRASSSQELVVPGQLKEQLLKEQHQLKLL